LKLLFQQSRRHWGKLCKS